ncbi:hypothetical protein SRB17_03560 [Streptomyces sp. RB17]|uniref:hypothetical protein n=1 Tax=Streptomyces sp. RB17 TaxID=2585197 RepID=UPI0012965485|nr:hypothetical protein [Streptomyces sp. RB17]MQY32408.1 hypothetical protein [Streptomyces sp. RB17]
MHKLRKAAVLIAAVSSLGLMGGTAHAGGQEGGKGGGHGDKFSVLQSSNCKSHDLNLDILGEVGLLDGLAGDLANGEGDPGAQATHLGSTMGCNNSAF